VLRAAPSRVLLPALAAVVAALTGAASLPAAPAEPLRVLFVGNSLTATNDLPSEVASLAKSTGRAIETGSVVADGFSLEDHWNSSDAPKEVLTGDWDVVVLQQGPSALPESQAHLKLWAQRFTALARRGGTRAGLLTVWPESYRRSALGAVIASYRNAAKASGAELYPAGDAWRRAWACDLSLALYGSDGFHPSRLGTYLAALVVYGRLFKSPLLTPALQPEGVSARTARTLQASAALSLGRRVPAARRCGKP
jgi:hypothetical protein